MIITRVALSNFTVHDELEVEFRPGINGILGRNGTGKSSLLDAIRFAITGESIGTGGVAANVRFGARTSKVSLTFTHAAHQYEIVRSFGVKTTQRLTGPGLDLTKQAEINRALEDILGASIDALLSNVFVPQGAIESILYSTDTQRLKEIQRTIGLTRIQDAEKAMMVMLAKHQPTIGLLEQMQSAAGSLAESETALKEARSKLSVVEAHIAALMPDKLRFDHIGLSIQQNAKAAVLKERLSVAVTRVTELDAKITGLETVLAEQSSSFSELSEQNRLAVQFDNQTLRYRAAIEAQQVTSDRIARLELELASLSEPDRQVIGQLSEQIADCMARRSNLAAIQAGTQPRPRLPPEETVLASLAALREPVPVRFEREQELVFQIDQLEHHLRVFASGTCPTCLRPLDQHDPRALQAELGRARDELSVGREQARKETERLRAQFLSERSALEARVKEFDRAASEALRTSLQKVDAKILTLREQLRLAEQLIKQYDGLVKELSTLRGTLSPVIPPQDPGLPYATDIIRSRFKEAENGLRALRDQLETARADRTVANGLVGRLRGEIDSLQLDELSYTEDELNGLRESAGKVSALTQTRQEFATEVAVGETRAAQYRPLYERLAQQYRAEEIETGWHQLCRRVRDIMHVSGLPKLLMRDYSVILNRRIQYYLDTWQAPFRLRIDPDNEMAFVAEFPDGRSFQASRLSGGQKVVASTSFRLAMADTFARSVGVLVLDEPSNYLDTDNITHLQQLLLRLRETAGHTGRQLFVVTHEESLVGFFDHTITLYPR